MIIYVDTCVFVQILSRRELHFIVLYWVTQMNTPSPNTTAMKLIGSAFTKYTEKVQVQRAKDMQSFLFNIALNLFRKKHVITRTF